MNEVINKENENAVAWKHARIAAKHAYWDRIDVIREKLVPAAKAQGSENTEKLFLVYSKLVNSALGFYKGQRNYLPIVYLDALKFIEKAVKNIISIEVDKGTHYKEIYKICKAKCEIIKELAFLPPLQQNVA